MKRGSYSLVHDDTDRVVQQTLAQDNGVQLWVHLVLIENGEDGHWVRGRKRRAKRQTLAERQF